MKVSKIKSTGKIFETQFGKDVDVLMANAKQYHPEDDIEIVDMSKSDFYTAIELQDEDSLSDDAKKEKKIKKEEEKILRNMAIEALEARGEL